jgi:hypothetical protein
MVSIGSNLNVMRPARAPVTVLERARSFRWADIAITVAALGRSGGMRLRSLRGASRSPRGLMVTGATQAGPVEFRMAVAHEPDFVPLQLGLEGTVSLVVFPAGADEPALVVTYGAPSLITAYEWSPGQEWEKAHPPPPPAP